MKEYIDIYFACLSVCLSVCLYSINVKTAEPIGPKFCLENPRFFFLKPRNFLVIVLQCLQSENVHNWNKDAPWMLSLYKISFWFVYVFVYVVCLSMSAALYLVFSLFCRKIRFFTLQGQHSATVFKTTHNL